MKQIFCFAAGIGAIFLPIEARAQIGPYSPGSAVVGEKVFVNDDYGAHLGCPQIYDLNNFYSVVSDEKSTDNQADDNQKWLDALAAALQDNCVLLMAGDTGFMIDTIAEAVGDDPDSPLLIQYDKIRMDSSTRSYWVDEAFVSPIVNAP